MDCTLFTSNYLQKTITAFITLIKNETLANTIEFIHENEICGEKHNIHEKEIIIEVIKHEIE